MEILDHETPELPSRTGTYLSRAGILLLILAALSSLTGFSFGIWKAIRVLNATGSPDAEQLADAIFVLLIAGQVTMFALLTGFLCCWIAYFKFSIYLRRAWQAMVYCGAIALVINLLSMQWLAAGSALLPLLFALGKRDLYTEK